MPVVPRYTDPQYATQALRSQPLSGNVSAASFGMNQARQTLQLAKGIGDAGEATWAIGKDMIDRNDQATLLEADDAASKAVNTLLYDPEKGLYARQGVNAKGATSEALTKLDDLQTRLFGGLNSRQQRKYQAVWMRRRRATLDGVSRHEAGEARKVAIVKNKFTINQAHEDAKENYASPDIVKLNVDKGVAAIRANPQGLPKEIIDEKVKEFTSKTYLGVIVNNSRYGATVKGLPTKLPDDLTGDDGAKTPAPAGGAKSGTVPKATETAPGAAKPGQRSDAGDTTGTVQTTVSRDVKDGPVTSPAGSAYGRYSQYLTPEDRRKAQSVLNHVNRTGVAQKWADAVMAATERGRFKNRTEALDYVRSKVSDPKLRDAIVGRIKTRFGERKEAEREAKEGNLKSAWDIVTSGNADASDPTLGIKPDIWYSLDTKEQEKLRQAAADKGFGFSRYDKPETRQKLLDMYYNDPERFARHDLYGERGELTKKSFEDLVKKQAEARAKKPADPLEASNRRFVEDQLKRVGIIAMTPGRMSKDQFKEQSVFMEKLEREVGAWETRNNKRIDRQNLREIVNYLLTDINPSRGDKGRVYQRRDMGDLLSGKDTIDYMGIDERTSNVPPEHEASIKAQYKARYGKDPSPAVVRQLYLRWLYQKARD